MIVDESCTAHLIAMHKYPWDGAVRLVCKTGGEFELALRVPGWCDSAQLQVNDETMPVESGSYARIRRTWEQGDTVLLMLSIEPRFVESHPYVDATRGCVVMERGPLVYCIEQPDQSEDLDDIRVNSHAPIRSVWEQGICGGVVTLHAEGGVLDARDVEGGLYRKVKNVTPALQRMEVIAIPYYAWGNRDPGKMRVWIPTM